MKETDLFEPVKALFEAEGYTVYSEVEGPSGRADLVAVHGAELVAVELKTSLSLDVMEQALGWTHYAHRVYAAVPKTKTYNHFGRFMLRRLGIGLIEVTFPDEKTKAFSKRWTGQEAGPEAKVDSMTPPKWNRNILPNLRQALREEQRGGPPGGTKGGGYVTEYKLTMERVRTYLRARDDWRDARDILDHCITHYASPRQSLVQDLMAWEKDWCESKKEGGKLYFRYKQGATQSTGGKHTP